MSCFLGDICHFPRRVVLPSIVFKGKSNFLPTPVLSPSLNHQVPWLPPLCAGQLVERVGTGWASWLDPLVCQYTLYAYG